MSHNLHKHVHMCKEQYILQIFPLLVLFMISDLLSCLWLLWNRGRKHLTSTVFKTYLLYEKTNYRMSVSTCAVCWVLGLCQNRTGLVSSKALLLCWCRDVRAGFTEKSSLVWGEDTKLIWIQHYLKFPGAAGGCCAVVLNTLKLVSTGELLKEPFEVHTNDRSKILIDLMSLWFIGLQNWSGGGWVVVSVLTQMWKMGRKISSLLQKLLLETHLKPSALLPFESTSMCM